MRCDPTMLKALVVCLACGTAAISDAGITKCVGRDGRISYSSEGAGACSALDTVSTLGTMRLNQPFVETELTAKPQAALENTAIRESAWAQAPATTHRTAIDLSTVKRAHASLQAMDRALVSMRTQKIASSR